MKLAFRIAKIFTAAAVCAALCLTAAETGRAGEADRSLHLVHTGWSSSVATANLVKAVLENRMDIRCRLEKTSADKMWEKVADKKADAMVSAWLPDTHAHYYDNYRDQVVNLGANLKGTKIGLVVPDITLGRLSAGTGIRNRPYINVDSIEELNQHAEKFNNRIIGIGPEAGIMRKTRQAMEAYGLDENFRLVEGSEVSMIAELSHAVRHQQWIVVTGWLPHWKFARWELKFLDDPKGVFENEQGHIATVVRPGLEKDMPGVFGFLDRFKWEPEDIGQLMLWIQEDQGRHPYEKALRWIRFHQEEVDSWVK